MYVRVVYSYTTVYVLRLVCRVFTFESSMQGINVYLRTLSLIVEQKILLHENVSFLFEQIQISPKIEAYCTNQIQIRNQRHRLRRKRQFLMLG